MGRLSRPFTAARDVALKPLGRKGRASRPISDTADSVFLRAALPRALARSRSALRNCGGLPATSCSSLSWGSGRPARLHPSSHIGARAGLPSPSKAWRAFGRAACRCGEPPSPASPRKRRARRRPRARHDPASPPARPHRAALLGLL